MPKALIAVTGILPAFIQYAAIILICYNYYHRNMYKCYKTWNRVVIGVTAEERMNLKGGISKIFGNFLNREGKGDISIYAKISNKNLAGQWSWVWGGAESVGNQATPVGVWFLVELWRIKVE